MATQNILLLADGFEEIEAITLLDVLRRAEVNVKSASITDTINVRGAHDIIVQADTTLKEISSGEIDMLILPGGARGVKEIEESSLAKEMAAKSKRIGAICAAPSALAKWGFARNYEMTCYPSFQKIVEQGGAKYSEDVVVIDKDRFTSRGPATALAFALKLVEILKGKEVAEKIKKAMLFHE